MAQFGLERRSWSEATYLNRNPDGDPFTITLLETPEEWYLFGVGVGLYLGEGSKTGWSVTLVNTNPGIHRTFLTFLERICGVQRGQLRAELNIFDDCNVDDAIEWWCNQLGLTSNQFSKPMVRQSRGGNYTNKSTHGTVAIRFHNVRLQNIILGWCSGHCEYSGNSEVGSFG